MEKKVLVVYFSRTGNTKKVATEIARGLGCDLQEIKSSPEYKKGFWGYQKALFHAAFKRMPNIQIPSSNITKYDLVIVGGPVWGGSISAPVRGFLHAYRGQIKDIAFFFTQGGTFSREKIKKQMTEVCNKSPTAVMAISEQELREENFKKRVFLFLKELNLPTQTPQPKRPRERGLEL